MAQKILMMIHPMTILVLKCKDLLMRCHLILGVKILRMILPVTMKEV